MPGHKKKWQGCVQWQRKSTVTPGKEAFRSTFLMDGVSPFMKKPSATHESFIFPIIPLDITLVNVNIICRNFYSTCLQEALTGKTVYTVSCWRLEDGIAGSGEACCWKNFMFAKWPEYKQCKKLSLTFHYVLLLSKNTHTRIIVFIFIILEVKGQTLLLCFRDEDNMAGSLRDLPW